MGKQFAQNGGTPEMDNTVGKALNCITNKFIYYIDNILKFWYINYNYTNIILKVVLIID